MTQEGRETEAQKRQRSAQRRKGSGVALRRSLRGRKTAMQKSCGNLLPLVEELQALALRRSSPERKHDICKNCGSLSLPVGLMKTRQLSSRLNLRRKPRWRQYGGKNKCKCCQVAVVEGAMWPACGGGFHLLAAA